MKPLLSFDIETIPDAYGIRQLYGLPENLSDKIKIATLGEPTVGEDIVIAKFFDIIEQETPQLISWNGGGFDLPVLHYRGLIHGVTAAKYWAMEIGRAS